MKNSISVVILSALIFSGCQTVQKGTTQTGNLIGQGAKATGGITEGITNGYSGTNNNNENPYGR